MLATGTETGWWTEEEKCEAENWLGYVFEPAKDTPPVAERYGGSFGREILAADPGWRSLLERGTPPRAPLSATQPVFSWLSTRLRAMDELQKATARVMLEMAIQHAEERWLSAKNAADLDPAVRDLTSTKAALGFRWRTNSWPGNFRPPEPPRFSRAVFSLGIEDFSDCWSIVGGPEPLLLPDPATDPAAFAKVRETWLLLTKGPQQFLKCDAVARRFAELDAVFQARFGEIERWLDEAILREASAAEFEREFARLKSHVLPEWSPEEVARRKYSPPNPPPKPGVEKAPDYRDTLAAQSRLPPGTIQPPRRESLRWRGDFAAWLEWRQAVEAGNAERTEKAGNALLGKAGVFEPRVAAFLQKRLTSPPASPLAPEPGVGKISAQNPAIAELTNALRRRAPDTRADSAPNIAALVEAWLRFDRGEDAENPRHALFAQVWLWIASRADGIPLCALRDRAARSALARLLPAQTEPDTIPLTQIFRRALEASIAQEAHDSTAHILALDSIACILTDEEKEAWWQTLDRLKTAKSQSTERGASARQSWLDVLRTSDSPAAATLAIEKLKRLAAAKSESGSN